MFSKSISEVFSKWQIFGQFGYFSALTIRMCNECKNFVQNMGIRFLILQYSQDDE